MAIEIIDFEGIAVEITRKAIKHLYIRIHPSTGLVKVSAPLKYNDQLLREHLEVKKAWIHQHRKPQHTLEKNDLQQAAVIYYLGKAYHLQMETHSGLPFVMPGKDQLVLHIKQNATTEEKQAVLDLWYRQQMALLIPDLLVHWTKIIGVAPREWRIKKMKTRWGTCNTRAKRIWLNLRLMEKHLSCIELVLVHELIHLLEPSHNKRFYRLMSKYLPEWKSRHKLLEGKSECLHIDA